MAIEEHIFQRLSGYAGLTALVSTRIYPGMLPETPTYPALTYEITNTDRESAMGSDPGIAHGRLSIMTYGTTYKSARDVKEQVRSALQRYRATLDGTQIMDTFVEDDRDEPPDLINGVIVRTRVVEFTVHYRE
jgi:hypothetical protein